MDREWTDTQTYLVVDDEALILDGYGTLMGVRTYLVIDDEALVGDAEVCVEDETQGVGLDAHQGACH